MPLEEPTTILIVDDEPNILKTLERALTLEGYEILAAKNGSEALDLVERADLVLTDMAMPGMDGLKLLLEIKKKKPEIPVAIMTAHGSVDGALKAMQEGAYDYLLKPCHTNQILLKVELGLRLSRYEHELRKRNEELERMQEELREKNLALERLATTDPLTGLANRRKFMERLAEETKTSQRYQQPLSLILCDIDHFKKINDTMGHPAGDTVLRQIAEILQARARESDLPARVGGEEFAVLLPSTTLEGGRQLGEAIKKRVAEHDFWNGASESDASVTASFGVAELAPSAAGEALFQAADRALYQAKESGRNRVAVS